MHPYLIGWIASDGHNAGTYWIISQNVDDKDIIKKLQKIYGGNLSIQKRKKNDGAYSKKDIISLRKNSRKDCNDLKKIWGVPVGNKTYSVAFPKRSSSEVWLYLKGVFEGDGSISAEGEHENHPRVQIISNRKWCNACRNFLSKFNIKSYIHDDKRHPGISSLIIRKRNNVHDFMERIYKNKKLPSLRRKLNHWVKLRSLNPRIIERRFISKKEEKEIKRELREGKTVRFLFKKYNYNVSSLWKIKREIFGSREEKTKKLVEKAKKMFSLVWQNCKICKKLKCSYKITRRAKDELGKC